MYRVYVKSLCCYQRTYLLSEYVVAALHNYTM